MPAVQSDFAFHGGANIGGMSRSGPVLDLGMSSPGPNEGWGWRG